MKTRYIGLIAIIMLVSASSSTGQLRQFSYQGIATTSSGVPLSGTHSMTINYYDKTGSSFGASETFSGVLFHDGVFDLALGGMLTGGGFPLTMDFTQGLSLGVSIDGGTEMKSKILGAPCAISGGGASIEGGAGIIVVNSGGKATISVDPRTIAYNMIPATSILGTQITAIAGNGLIQTGAGMLNLNADNTSLQIVNNKVTVGVGGVGTSCLANGGVTSAKLANGAVGLAQVDQTQIATLPNGHLSFKQATAPTTSVSNTTNITASSVMNATDVAGKVIFTSAGTAGPTDYVQVKFNKPYTTAPIVVISPADLVTAPEIAKFYVSSSTTDFSIKLDAATAGTFTFNYMVMETQ